MVVHSNPAVDTPDYSVNLGLLAMLDSRGFELYYKHTPVPV